MRSPALQRIIGPLATTKEKPVQQKRPSTANINTAIYKALGPKKIYPKNEGLVMH